MMKTSRNRKWLIVLLVITLIFIWGNSMFDKESSAEESRFVVRFLEMFFGTGNVSEHFVRKLAHFTEYAILGAELFGLFGKYLMSATHGLFVAMVDESIQLIVKRGSSLADVWLDFSGVLFGALVVMLIIRIAETKTKAKN